MNSTPQPGRRKILFVCARNKIRSYTAEKMFAGSALYDVRSRGMANDARIKLTERDLSWADEIFVMEKEHKDRIVSKFRPHLGGKKISCLFIKDIYAPMDSALLSELRRKLEGQLSLPS